MQTHKDKHYRPIFDKYPVRVKIEPTAAALMELLLPILQNACQNTQYLNKHGIPLPHSTLLYRNNLLVI